MTGSRRPAATPKSEDGFDIANRLFFRLYQASNLMHKAGTSAVSDFGVTTQQWAVLGALSRSQAEAEAEAESTGFSVKELMDYLMVSRQSLTAILDRLEVVDLVERVKANGGGDGRLRHVRLTPKGAQTWKELLPSIQGFYSAALAEFSLEESFLLMRLLDRLSAGLAKL